MACITRKSHLVTGAGESASSTEANEQACGTATSSYRSTSNSKITVTTFTLSFIYSFYPALGRFRITFRNTARVS